MSAVEVWLNADDEHIVECAECGHLHFDTRARGYVDCPLKTEGCECLGQPSRPSRPRCWCGGEDGEHNADAHAEEGRW